MEYIRKIVKIGNSEGVIIPSYELARLKLTKGSEIRINIEGNVITMRPVDGNSCTPGHYAHCINSNIHCSYCTGLTYFKMAPCEG